MNKYDINNSLYDLAYGTMILGGVKIGAGIIRLIEQPVSGTLIVSSGALLSYTSIKYRKKCQDNFLNEQNLQSSSGQLEDLINN